MDLGVVAVEVVAVVEVVVVVQLFGCSVSGL